MGNFDSREQQLTFEIAEMFIKNLTQTNITKKHLISLSRKFKKLKKINEKKFKNLANRTNSLMRNAKKINPTKDFLRYHRLYGDFLEKTK